MAPKKKPQKPKSKSKPNLASFSSSSGPRLQISAENENRLRRLLISSGQPTQPALAIPVQETLSKPQKAKKLRNIYENLSCEGFSDDQIELALASLKENATFETALDWLCLNLPGSELPLKFSSGTSINSNGGSVGVVLTAQEGRVPSMDLLAKIEDTQHVSVRIKGRQQDDETLNWHQQSQKDWIRQYLEQQEEDESKNWDDDAVDGSLPNKGLGPRPCDIIVKEYQAARLEATKAKEMGDKKRQEHLNHIIRELKQELSDLGVSADIMGRDFGHKHTSGCGHEDICTSSVPYDHLGVVMSSDAEGSLAFIEPVAESAADGRELSSSVDIGVVPISSSVSSEREIVPEEEPADVELGGLFSEDAASDDILPVEVLELQKKEKMRESCSEKNLEKLDGIWKKGDPKKIPKAVLHQLCQKSGWEAPKFSKVLEKGKGFSYAISILRKTCGRGKNRKAGGLITIQLPEQNETFESAEDAQNRVAAFAINQLFPDLPIHMIIIQPYASLFLQWKEGELSSKLEDHVDDRRAGFVNWLLNSDLSTSANVSECTNNFPEVLRSLQIEEPSGSNTVCVDPFSGRLNYTKDLESSYLRQQEEKKKETQKYKEMLKSRAALPITGLKGDTLQKLRENNVLVVCGETGSGKTTQVPQFVLDDMIESGHGGHCNIICTQPRRIAAISVAERVADERCEPSPGADGSLVGYQVRLDSARNDKTKLLFCTTGILLRKLMGDRNLTGITHVIVDEVHERSLLGDFLLIVLKSLIEKKYAHGLPQLKVILMSATVDSSLFSRYFGNCPVLAAQGRTHPVTTYFLEDIYESINYHLASDSPAYLRHKACVFNKNGLVKNRRGKKDLVLSAWGDDSLLLDDVINPYYMSSNYQSFSEQTQKNLKKLNEDVIDFDLLEDLVCYVDETCGDGAILVFLPGVAEIYALVDRLAASHQFGGPSADWIIPLHSSVSSTEQKKAFCQPPGNMRKVIIATNIAETSITIDDVVYVIDCGKHKENRYNPHKKLSSMVEDWISQANARQRRGRAGRVKPGICFCLYTRYRFEKLMRPYQVPEMLRMPLLELCLQIKLLSLGRIKPFLSMAIEPPREEAIASAVSLLYEVGAIEGDEELTPLGHHLAKLPVNVLIGKMMLYGAIFGCLSPILSISAFLSYKSPFVYPKDERQNAERAKLALLSDKLDGSNDSNYSDKQSDHLLMMVAYAKWQKILHEKGVNAAKQFCNSFFLSSSVMYMIRDMRIQFGKLLADIGLITLPSNYQIVAQNTANLDSWLSEESQPFNMYSHQAAIVKAILCAGLYPNVAATKQGLASATLNSIKQSGSYDIMSHPIWYDGRREVHIHPSSINSSSKALQHPFLVFLEKVVTNKVFLRDTTIVCPFPILLFGGSINIQHQAGLVIIDGWLKLTAPAQSAVLFKKLRSSLHSLLKELIKKPKSATLVDNEVVRSIIQLLLDEDKSSK